MLLVVDQLTIESHSDRSAVGAAAATHVAALIRDLLDDTSEIRMVFAAAPSQSEFLSALVDQTDVDWSRITAFHMDEYIDLDASNPHRFSNWLDKHLFQRVPFKKVERLNPSPQSPESECKRYADLLSARRLDIVCMGIGENGHIAFNDPPVANFEDPEWVKVVELDQACREQQAHDAFGSLDAVPTRAVTMTIPALMSASHAACVVPGPRKAEAVAAAVLGPVSTDCPASILRTHGSARLFLDRDSASGLV